MAHEINVERLTRGNFEPFGQVIEAEHYAEMITINDGFATRYHDLAEVDVSRSAGRPLINIFRGRPRPLPIAVHMMERHPLGTQAFVPLHQDPFLIVAAPVGDIIEPEKISAFITNGRQGINYGINVWHFPLLVLGSDEKDFLVVDRGGEGDNCEEYYFDADQVGILNISDPRAGIPRLHAGASSAP